MAGEGVPVVSFEILVGYHSPQGLPDSASCDSPPVGLASVQSIHDIFCPILRDCQE